MDERVPFTVLGRIIGTGIGWGEIDHESFIIYDFIPDEKYDFPTGDLAILYEKGVYEVYGDDDIGEPMKSGDLVEVLMNTKEQK